MTTQRGLCLATSQGATIWQGGQSQDITIDLTFLTPRLYNDLAWCAPLDPAEEMEDHEAVETILRDALIMALIRERWS